MSNLFLRPDPAAQRAERSYQALSLLTDRHAATPELRQRQAHPTAAEPGEVVRLVGGLAGGVITIAAEEPEVDHNDLLAALTLVPNVRADLDALEFQLITAARSRGMTWQDVAFGLGLNTPQAAKQRHDRLLSRSEEDTGA